MRAALIVFFHFILKSVGSVWLLACCYLFRLFKKRRKEKAWQLLCVTVTFPSSCLTCIRCTVAHYPESWWCEAGLLFLKRPAGRNGNRRKSFLKVSHLCHFKKKKNLFWICGCQVIFLIMVIRRGSAILNITFDDIVPLRKTKKSLLSLCRASKLITAGHICLV